MTWQRIGQGLGATILRNTPANAVYLGSFEVIKRELAKFRGCNVTDLPLSVVAAAGGIGGILYWIAVFPMDVIKSSMMTDSIIKSERQYTTILSTAKVRTPNIPYDRVPQHTLIACCLGSGLRDCCILNPGQTNLLRHVMSSRSDFFRCVWCAWVAPQQQLYAEGGLGRFYKGFTPCIIRACPANAAMLVTVDYVGNILSR